MQFLITVTPGPMPPPPQEMRRAQEWLNDKLSDGTFECCYAIAGGGGFAVGKADSHEQLMDLLLDYPLSPFVYYDVKPLVGLNDAFDRIIPIAERMAAQQPV
jgi:muconolactone delta-isomerase